MAKNALSLILLAAPLACALAAAPAHAQPIRVFVALTGSDANPCTFASPCKSAQHAHDVVAAGGEIRMLDQGAYGLLTITKAVSIQGHGYGEIAASGGATAITINAGATDTVSLRGLIVEGIGTGLNGIAFNSGAALDIQDCVVRNFTATGISFQPSATSSLVVSNTHIVATKDGIGFVAATGAAATGALDRVSSEKNMGTGILASIPAGGTGSGNLTISNSVASENGVGGIRLVAESGTMNVMVRDSVVSNNLNGVVSGTNGTTWLTRSTITGNVSGLTAFGPLVSFGDNTIVGNTHDGLPTSTWATR